MRVVPIALLLTAAVLDVAAEEPAWKLDLRTRAERRADRARNAERHAVWRAQGRGVVDAENNVVVGGFDPTILAPIELVQYVTLTFNAPGERQEKVRREWTSRGAAQLLGEDFWGHLQRAFAEPIRIDYEERRIGRSPAKERDAIRRARDPERFADGGECAARAEAVVVARALWGEAFDRFLYEVVAPGVNYYTSSSDPKLLADPEHWLDHWRWMEGGCR
jgi:hypothetical protein